MIRKLHLVGLVLLMACNATTEQVSEERTPAATSLLGTKLYPRERSDSTLEKLQANLRDAQMVYKAHPEDEMSIIWYGRRLAYLDRYNDAIAVYSEGLKTHPQSYKILRHRGHRYISIRDFDRAIADLSRAAVLAEGTQPEIEPDGQPNKLDTALTTTQWNIYYHLGLAYYLNGNFEKALEAYESCYALSTNMDVLVAITDWMYMTLRRMELQERAEELLVHIPSDAEVIENDSYLKRIRMYQGLVMPRELLSADPEDLDFALKLATQGYGVGNWHLYTGDTSQALTVFNNVITGDYWPAFGFIAAEADLARLERSDPL